MDHAMLAVGYGTDPVTKLNYWILKNQWGRSWFAFLVKALESVNSNLFTN